MSMPDPEIGRTLPHDAASERGVLAAMLNSEEAIGAAAEHVSGPDFYEYRHEVIYDTIIDMYGRGQAVDPITLTSELIRGGRLRDAGGHDTIMDLVGDTTIIYANATVYADSVREKAVKRRLITAGSRIVQMGYSGEDEASAMLDLAQAELDAVAPDNAAQDYRLVMDTLEPTLDEMEALQTNERPPGILTGYADLDALLGGLRGGQMVIIAARPGMGKSTAALDICRSAARHGDTAYFCSLEMVELEITMRLLAAEAKVPLSAIRQGHVSESDWLRISAKMGEIGAMPLFIDDSPHMTMTEIRAKARRLKQRNDLKLLVIDYMQLMSSGKKVESRQMEVSEFSRQIKLLAKELDIPVVALSQLNRGPEQRASKRPLMSDLRESGSLEQDADIILLLHRDDAYEAESSRPGEADLIVAKHRNGPTRDIALAFQGHYSRFVDMADFH